MVNPMSIVYPNISGKDMNKKYENAPFDENNDHTLMIRSLYAFKKFAEKSQINLMHLRKGVYTRQKSARDREHLRDYH